jgi:hypothetical protein
MSTHQLHRPYLDRRQFIGGSDARIIMGDDEAALAIPLTSLASSRRGQGWRPFGSST